MKPEIKQDEPMNANQMARKLKRSRWGVKLAIDRLEVEPVQTLGGVNYYPATTLAQVESTMRKANSIPAA